VVGVALATDVPTKNAKVRNHLNNEAIERRAHDAVAFAAGVTDFVNMRVPSTIICRAVYYQ
jgi:hypothetical protein